MNLSDISIDLHTGAVSYPKVEGFTLDVPKMRRVASLFLDRMPAADVVMAYRLAIHDQLAAHRGLATLRSAS